MDRLVVALALGSIAVMVALAIQRRRPAAPARAPATYEAPSELDRSDFERPDAPWLVVAFTSATCDTCSAVWERVALLASDQVAVEEVEFSRNRDLHERYGIDAVPITCIADRNGNVLRSFVGPVSATHLWAAVAEVREPGSVPSECGTEVNPTDVANQRSVEGPAGGGDGVGGPAPH